ncbi:MAG: hypothetical protein PHV59_00475, partial [Victivallales bacterium]|nr:hypothetical protein [Victivallales bacterium]
LLFRGIKKILPRITDRHVHSLLLSLIAVICITKALHPPTTKDYICDIAAMIQTHSSGRQALIVCDIDDPARVVWHAGARRLALEKLGSLTAAENLKQALQTLNSRRQGVFLLVKLRNVELQELFRKQGAEFPAEFKLLGEFRVKENLYYSLYKAEAK